MSQPRRSARPTTPDNRKSPQPKAHPTSTTRLRAAEGEPEAPTPGQRFMNAALLGFTHRHLAFGDCGRPAPTAEEEAMHTREAARYLVEARHLLPEARTEFTKSGEGQALTDFEHTVRALETVTGRGRRAK